MANKRLDLAEILQNETLCQIAKLNSQKLRTAQTEAEKRLWYRIRSGQLGVRFYRQKPLLTYIVDFYCPKANLVIELDGSQHYEPEH